MIVRLRLSIVCSTLATAHTLPAPHSPDWPQQGQRVMVVVACGGLVPGPGPGRVFTDSRIIMESLKTQTGSKLCADNTSVVTVMLDPPGPQVLKTRKRELAELNRGREKPTTQPPAASGARVSRG